ncbi:DUF1552 domain-containing protein [Calycomorphotria hydatis]|uniref:DUF1552 domain-containing protein n=1 Tax=Calycomorphotria hydatis TaxID=2528027 RepID=A0A517TA44_9PLAN|nr:DUF1552 domain-containing protein [Calycomorphotria hydatis]QDT65233.1 hypothetical protein V22_24800 [Calycomorphotria hydatis]
MIYSKIKRRQFLKGAGVSLALPVLNCTQQSWGAGASDGASPKRMLLISNNLGVLPKPFFPVNFGRDYTLSKYLHELESFRDDFTIFSGLSHPSVVGGHSTENCFLTGAKDPTRSGFRNTISLDQYTIEHLGQQTRFPTLNLGVNINRANRSLSWTRDGVLLPAEDSPRQLFQKMFVNGNKNEVAHRLYQLKERGSILDAVLVDMHQYCKGLGQDDRHRVEQYFTSVRELETRLHTAREWELRPKPTIDQLPPDDINDKAQFFLKFELMLSMARLALESDSTRIVTVMVDGFATPVFLIGEEERSLNGYHNLSHHGQAKEKIAQLEKVDVSQMRLLNDLFSGLAETTNAHGRLLEQTMVLFGSNMGDANVHNNTNLPILLGGGGFQHGQHLQFDHQNNTPLCNLFVSMLQQMGIETSKFSSSTGTLTGL